MIHESHYSPQFKVLKEKGRFPKDLLFGFENEVEVGCDKNCDIDDVVKRLEKYSHLYSKDDGSLDNGCEINSHPFNFNYFVKNYHKFMEYTKVLKRWRTGGSCATGFHIHLSSGYFNSTHLKKMVMFVYNNKDFFYRLSQRNGEDNLYEYASLENLLENKAEELDPDGEDEIKFLTSKMASLIVKHRMTSHYDGLDIKGKYKTVEFRLFQGTTNKKLIRTYLETMMALVLYTKNTTIKDLCVSGFKKFVAKNKKRFSYIHNSKILEGNCKYQWGTN